MRDPRAATGTLEALWPVAAFARRLMVGVGTCAGNHAEEHSNHTNSLFRLALAHPIANLESAVRKVVHRSAPPLSRDTRSKSPFCSRTNLRGPCAGSDARISGSGSHSLSEWATAGRVRPLGLAVPRVCVAGPDRMQVNPVAICAYCLGLA